MKEVYDEKVQHDVVGPVFCIDYPREVSPLARVHRDDPDYVERFELIVAGFELCNAYCEQNDPVEQLAAFEAEARAKAGRRPRGRRRRPDYVRALEHGHAVHRRARHRDRPAGDAARQRRLDPRGDPLPDAAPGVRPAAGPAARGGAAPAGGAHAAGRGRRGRSRPPSPTGAPSVVALPDMAPSAHAVPPPPRRRDRHPRAVRAIAALTALPRAAAAAHADPGPALADRPATPLGSARCGCR